MPSPPTPPAFEGPPPRVCPRPEKDPELPLPPEERRRTASSSALRWYKFSSKSDDAETWTDALFAPRIRSTSVEPLRKTKVGLTYIGISQAHAQDSCYSHSSDTISPRDVRRLVNVDLQEVHIGVLLCQSLEGGGNGMAGAAPSYHSVRYHAL